MNEERIKELFSNEEFVKDLFESKSCEEVQRKLADKDVEVSIDELKKTLDLLKKKQSGELSDEELEAAAGGSLWFACGTVITILVASGFVSAGKKYFC